MVVFYLCAWWSHAFKMKRIVHYKKETHLNQLQDQSMNDQKSSRFVRLVTPSHIETLDAWCEHTGKSAPKSIVQAIELARKYEQEMPRLLDELKVWKLAVERTLVG